MHPALHPSQLQTLPLPQRKIAVAACKRNCSIADITAATRLLRTAVDKFDLFVPLLNVLIDPSRLPSLEDMQELSDDTLSIINAVFVALAGISAPEIPVYVQIELWPRALESIHFLWTLRDHIPAVRKWEERVYVDFLQFTHVLARQGGNIYTNLFLSSPGFFHILLTTWTLLLKSRTRWDESLANMFPLVAGHHADRQRVIEMIDGAGGTLEALVGVLVKIISLLAPSPDTRLPVMHRDILGTIFILVRTIDLILKPGERRIAVSSLFPMLKSFDMAKVLTISICASAGTMELEPGPMLLDARQILYFFLLVHDGGDDKNLLSALQNGLLLAIIRCARRHLPEETPSSLDLLLLEFLAPATVYYHLLDVMWNAYQNVKHLTTTEDFRTSKTFASWSTFVDLLVQRHNLKVTYEQRTTSAKGACDNVNCNKIAAKATLRRCSGCRTFLYCSPTCQKSDWKTGGHREMCAMHKLVRGNTCDESFPSRDRAFIRFLLHEDYLAARKKIIFDTMTTLHANPRMGSVILFDYRDGPVSITPYTLRGAMKKTLLVFDFDVWLDWWKRVGASVGKIQLHITALTTGFRRGFEGRAFIIPLRATTEFIPLTIVGMKEKRAEWTLSEFNKEFGPAKVPKGHIEIH
ncbi:hypothetical protein B0H16DRAFT_1690374 [Mycena metata]|uniref:MYND-type domain-containing protein n=1 Tax=Mycena metata TaxID=1033252 RepID=A0AAD7J3V9_9AGAR|nr:hypothetical protein B0H16DRAFT_1690374 [Mycena metata]